MASLPCFIHTLQLCIHDSILSQPSVKEILTLCRGIAGHFNRSAVSFAKLKNIQQQLNTAPHKMKQDVPTRWNSSFEMLNRMFEQKVSLATYEAEFSDIAIPTQYQWGIVEKLVHVLAPFEKLTKTCGRREETAARIIPSVLALKVVLNKASASDKYAGVTTMIEALKKSVTKRLDKFLLDKVLCVTTFLDPRFKLVYQHITDNVIKTWVEEAWEELQEGIDSDSEDSSTAVKDAGLSSGFIDIEDCFEEVANLRAGRKEKENSQEAEAALDETEDPAAEPEPRRKRKKSNAKILQEIDSYISLPLLDKEGSPFAWWGNCGKQLEKLRKLASKYLTAPPSSIESERLFSAGGNIYEATRNRLKSDNGEYLMFVHYNLKMHRQLKEK
ncbi:unnamed protein product [Rotaria magnacalcarata]|uniref:HAT C-terminal dimerisation domain-containing protein n=1 Tax=Rotaria magnacalcarata TaxID=392030 RepID=A0A816NM87_9BILA|nr:unnamed protein product [Rotaria magnacalcarata]CAF4293369.1 unnamed protein product [Rotaria magnacalcarata]